MADLHQPWGSDLRLSATGDLLLVDGVEAGRHRVLRRLLTNPGDYLWAMLYGAGLPSQIGETTQAATIRALVRRQMLMEPAVSQQPPPQVEATPIFNGVIVQIQYRDATTSDPVRVGFTVER